MKKLGYHCKECGELYGAWFGRCTKCGAWNTIEEVAPDAFPKKPSNKTSQSSKKALPLSCVPQMTSERLLTGVEEFDRVLGGGVTLQSAVLIGGEPGIGKSTLLLQTAAALGKKGQKVLYITGEETAGQVRSRASRLELATEGVFILATGLLEEAIDAMNELTPALVIVDSIQTLRADDIGQSCGTVTQLKFCAEALTDWVKTHPAALFMVAHVTKDGSIAGPKTLEHLVDTVISFEKNSEEIRFLHAQKNRYGCVDELGIFSMTAQGLKSVADSESLFLPGDCGGQKVGTSVTCVFEGNRVFLVEIQALTAMAKGALSRVYSEKIDSNKVARVAAILERYASLSFSELDLYVNVAGGIKLSESAIDAALATALYSARSGIALSKKCAVIGELSLAGEVRPVSKSEQRIRAARNMGYNTVFLSEATEGATQTKTVSDLIKKAFSA